MDVLVITGGIGSGKTEVCRILQETYGCGVYNADDRVKMLYDVHPTLLDDIQKLVSEPLRDGDGKFVPARLSTWIFKDRSLLRKVEALVFPALVEDFRSWSQQYADSRFVVFESATVLEKPEFKGFGDKIVLVDSLVETRLERACMRDSAPRESVYARMFNQKMMNSISDGELQPEVDAVIHNLGTLTDLKYSTIRVINELYDN